MKVLDKTKPFNTIYGDALVRYEQDGDYFDSAGEYLLLPVNAKDTRAPMSDRPVLHLQKKN